MQHRFATAADLDRLADWNRQLIEDERADNPMDASQLRERMRGWLAASYRAVIFEIDAQPVGYALYLPDEDGIYPRQLFVDRAQRRRGIGRRAVERLRTQVFPSGTRVTLRVLVHNEPALAFWRALGFADHAVTLALGSAR